MPWTATYSPDTELPDTGTASATWTAPRVGVPDENLTFSARVDSKAGLAAFVRDAKDALAVYQNRKARIDAVNSKISQAMNS